MPSATPACFVCVSFLVRGMCFVGYFFFYRHFRAPGRGARARAGSGDLALQGTQRGGHLQKLFAKTPKTERNKESRSTLIHNFQRKVSPRTNHTLSGSATPAAATSGPTSKSLARPPSPSTSPSTSPATSPSTLVRPPRPHVSLCISLRERAPRPEGEAARGRPLAARGPPWGWWVARLWAPWPERGPLAPHRAATPCWRHPVVQASSGGKGRGAALWPREMMACVARPATVSVAIVSIEEGIAAL